MYAVFLTFGIRNILKICYIIHFMEVRCQDGK